MPLQGENYPFVREILMPDFSVQLIQKVVGLIYKGYVDIIDYKEMETVKEALEYFQIRSVNECKENAHSFNLPLKIHHANRIPQDIFKASLEAAIVNELQPQVVLLKNNIILEEKSVEMDVSNKSIDAHCPPTPNGSTQICSLDANQLVIKLTRLDAAVGPQSSPGCNVRVPNNSSQTNVSSDTTNDGWEEPNYNDRQWFEQSAKTCQICQRKYQRPEDSTVCVTSHDKMRCYFCFNVYNTINELYLHFKCRHSKSENENCTSCPFCKAIVPFKLVSCHVIGSHFRKLRPYLDAAADDEISDTRAGSSLKATKLKNGLRRSQRSVRLRSTTGSLLTLSPKSNLSAKKEKWMSDYIYIKRIEPRQLGIPDLNVTIKKKTAFGRNICFQIQKSRILETLNCES